jgi:hypothetical protein
MKLLPVASLLALAGCPFLEVEAEVSEVCVTYANVQIDGATGELVQTSFTANDLGELSSLVEHDADLRFNRAEIRAIGGASLGFVTTARVAIASGNPDSSLPMMPIVECDGDCLPEGATLAIPAQVRESAVAYLQTGSLVVDLELRGQLPATTWSADIDVCMTGKVGYAF